MIVSIAAGGGPTARIKGGEAVDKKPLEGLVRKHGLRKLCRDSGIALGTVQSAVGGLRVPTEVTAEKIAWALGLSVGDIEWPLGVGVRPRIGRYIPPHRKRPALDMSDLGPDTDLHRAIEDLIEREVEKRVASFSGTAAQSEPIDNR